MKKTTSDDGEGRLHVRLPREFFKRLKVECARREITIQAATQEALEAWLRQRGRA